GTMTYEDAAFAMEQAGAAAVAQSVRTRDGNLDKKPLRYIKDPNPAFSSIAVNPENDMVILTDENLYRIVEYSRGINPTVNGISQPRRVISGDNTKMEMLCGSYIDPKTLD